jgi:cation:H+ antiporter
MKDLVLLAIGFGLVIKGADLVVEGASALAKRLRVSDLAIGLTVVAFGTSLPELSVNVLASVEGRTGIAIGNVLGSNVANILLILGVAGVLRPLVVTERTVWKEVPLSLLAALLVAVIANDRLIDGSGDSALTRVDGLVLLSFFIIFLYYSVGSARDVPAASDASPSVVSGLGLVIARVVSGLALLILGGASVVHGAVNMAGALGLTETVVGTTIVALGTSLPELATSAVAAYKGNSDIAVGNVVGSNIFNIFLILGVSSVIQPLPFSSADSLNVGMVAIASLLLLVFMRTGKRQVVDRWEAALFLCLYVLYVSLSFSGGWRR